MKKYYLVVFVIICIGKSNAQYTDLYNFNGITGSTPLGSLTLSNNKLFGMTYLGGINGDGLIFCMDTNGNNYRDIWDFDDTGTNGAKPFGSLTLSGDILYGMTSVGGTNNYGCIFSIDTNGTHYKDLFDFNGTNGKYPYGSLTLSKTTLYGMVYQGGTNGLGCAFSFNVSSNVYVDLLDFNFTNGSFPEGSFILSGKTLYGMAQQGGTGTFGCVFALDTNGNHYKDLLDFTYSVVPVGSLTLSGNTLYGMTEEGGGGDGNIFAIDTNGNNYKNLLNFDTINCREPSFSLSIVGKKLYGTTQYGGTYGSGCVFAIDTNGANYKSLVDFGGFIQGANPISGVIISQKKFYGMTSYGGTSGDGVVFRIDTGGIASVDNLKAYGSSVIVYPNPSNGLFNLQSKNYEGRIINFEVYNILGEKLYDQYSIINPQLSIDLCTQPNGIYLYKALADNGTLIDEGKLIIMK